MSGLLLYDALNASYLPTNDARDALVKDGYIMDTELSNIENKVYHNDKTGDLLIAYRGSKNLRNDWLDTNVKLLQNRLNQTERFKRSEDVYNKAKTKYHKDSAILVGDSLGGSLASSVGSDNDKIYTYNKGLAGIIGNKKNEQSFRNRGDVVSLLGMFSKNTKTLGYDKNPLFAHNINNLKKEKIFI